MTRLPPSRAGARLSARRMWHEQAFRDEKRQGFGWQQSRVHQPEHAQRLLLVPALAYWWLIRLGAWVIKRGWRALLESRSRRQLSVFQLGRDWLADASARQLALCYRLRLYPPPGLCRVLSPKGEGGEPQRSRVG